MTQRKCAGRCRLLPKECAGRCDRTPKELAQVVVENLVENVELEINGDDARNLMRFAIEGLAKHYENDPDDFQDAQDDYEDPHGLPESIGILSSRLSSYYCEEAP